ARRGVPARRDHRDRQAVGPRDRGARMGRVRHHRDGDRDGVARLLRSRRAVAARERGGAMKTADELGVIACPLCELVMRAAPVDAECPRCGERLPRVSRRNMTRCWALVIAAAALYLPANVLPMMNTEQFPMHRSDTILS